MGLIAALISIVLVWGFWPLPEPQVSESLRAETVDLFQNAMLQGQGLSVSTSGKSKTPYLDGEPRYGTRVSYDRLYISIKQPLAEGSYFDMQGGPIDRATGEKFSYVLYIQKSGVYFMPQRFAWNDVYRSAHYSAYLIRKNNETGQGEIIRSYEDINADRGSLKYVEDSGRIELLLCGAVREYIQVQPDDVLVDNTNLFKLSCPPSAIEEM